MRFGTHAPCLVCVLRLSYLVSLGSVVVASLWLFFIWNFCAVTCLCDRVLNIRLFLCLWSGYAASRWMSRKLRNHAASFLNLRLFAFFPCFLSLSVDSSRSMASTWSLTLMRKLWVHMQVFIFHLKKKNKKPDNKLLHPPSLCPVIAPDAGAWTPTCTPLCLCHLLYSVQLQSSCSLYSPPVPQST